MDGEELSRAVILAHDRMYDDILNHGLPLEFWSWIRLVRPENPSDNDLFKFNTVSEMIQKHTYNLEIKT